MLTGNRETVAALNTKLGFSEGLVSPAFRYKFVQIILKLELLALLISRNMQQVLVNVVDIATCGIMPLALHLSVVHHVLTTATKAQLFFPGVD